MKDHLILIDCGHGHLIEGTYQTAGKRYEDSTTHLYEGVLNKAIGHLLALRLSLSGTKCHMINPETRDLTLDGRVWRANRLHDRYKCLYISIHHNAFRLQAAYGAEIFTSSGDTASDPLAEELGRMFEQRYPHRKLRHESVTGKFSKNAKFRVLEKTRMPAVLTEFGFMTNKNDRDYITSAEGMDEQVRWLYDWIQNIINNNKL